MKVYLRFTALDMILNNLKELVVIHKLHNLKISTFDPSPCSSSFIIFWLPSPPAKMTSCYLKIKKYIVYIFSHISTKTLHYTWVVSFFFCLRVHCFFGLIKMRLEMIREDPCISIVEINKIRL